MFDIIENIFKSNAFWIIIGRYHRRNRHLKPVELHSMEVPMEGSKERGRTVTDVEKN